MCVKLNPEAGGGTSPAALPARSRQLRDSNCCCHLRHPRDGHPTPRGSDTTRHAHGTGQDEGVSHHAAERCPKPPHEGLSWRWKARCHALRCLPRSGDTAGAAPLSLPQPRPPSPGGTRRCCPAGPQTPRPCRRLPAVPCRHRTGRGRCTASGRPDAARMPAGPREDPREGGKLHPVPGAPPRSPAPEAGSRPAPPSPPGTRLAPGNSAAPSRPPSPRPSPTVASASHGRSSRARPAAPGWGTGPAVRGGSLGQPRVARRPRQPRRDAPAPRGKKSCPRGSGRESNSPFHPAAPPRPRLKLTLPPGAAAAGGHRPAPPLPGGGRSQPERAARSRQPIARQSGPCARSAPRWAGPARSEGGRWRGRAGAGGAL